MASWRAACSSPEELLKFRVSSSTSVSVVSGDITAMQADAVVIGEDAGLTGIGAVASAIARAGGPQYSRARDDMKRKQVPFSPFGFKHKQSVYWCDAGPHLPYKRVYHAILPMLYGIHAKQQWQTTMTQLYTSVCAEADTRNRETSIVVPILGSGGGGGDLEDSVWAALEGIKAYQSVYHLQDVILVEWDSTRAKKIVDICNRWMDRQTRVHKNLHIKVLPPSSAGGGAWGMASPGTRAPRQQAGLHPATSGLSGCGLDSSSPQRSSHRQPGSRPHAETGPGGGRAAASWGPPGSGSRGGEGFPRASSSSSQFGRETSTSTSRGWRNTGWEEERKEDETSGKLNYHEREVLRRREERGGKQRGRGHPRQGRESAPEDYAEGGRAQRHRFDFHGESSERRHNGRSSIQDERHETPMEGVEEDPVHFTRPRERPSPEPAERYDSNSTKLNIVHLSGSSGEESEGEYEEREAASAGGGGQARQSGREGARHARVSQGDASLPALSRDRSSQPGFERSISNDLDDRSDYKSLFPPSQSKGRESNKTNYGSMTGTSARNRPPSTHQYERDREEKCWNGEGFSGGQWNISPSSAATTSYQDRSHTDTKDHQAFFRSLSLENKRNDADDLEFEGKGATRSHLGNDGHGVLFRSLPPQNKLKAGADQDVEGQGAKERRSASMHSWGAEGSGRTRDRAGWDSSTGSLASQREDQTRGTMPDGKMIVNINDRIKLDGSNVVVIEYSFPNGIQVEGHPNPGKPYKGTFCRAFLPDNQEGQEVLDLLQKAFDRKLTFRIETEADGEAVVKYADTLHLTSHKDPDVRGYLRKVKEVLHNKYHIF